MTALAFGFLGGREAKDAGVTNAGLHDRKCQWFKGFTRLTPPPPERQALRWVQKYVSAFGGDPEKVTM